MRKLESLLFFILFVTFIGNAQTRPIITIIDDDPTPIEYEWLRTDSKILTHMGVAYKKPLGFNEIQDSECFQGYPRLENTFKCLSPYLSSDDNHFIAFLPIYRPMTKDDSAFYQRLSPHTDFSPNLSHFYQMQGHLKDYYGDDYTKKWAECVSYYPEESAKSIFNADTAIRVMMKLHPEDYYKDDFKYIDILFLQKNGKGFLGIYCFYTERAKAKMKDYWSKIEGIYRYKKR